LAQSPPLPPLAQEIADRPGDSAVECRCHALTIRCAGVLGNDL
jgi:hypothetical protein